MKIEDYEAPSSLLSNTQKIINFGHLLQNWIRQSERTFMAPREGG
jgi:hypothetical protein